MRLCMDEIWHNWQTNKTVCVYTVIGQIRQVFTELDTLLNVLRVHHTLSYMCV